MTSKNKELKKNGSIDFTFGEPVPVLDSRELMGYAESYWQGEYYEPPVSLAGLAKSFGANSHHASAIHLKKNRLVSYFKPNKLLSRKTFSRLAIEYITFGNCYPRMGKNVLGENFALDALPAKSTRVAKNNQFIYQPNWKDKTVYKDNSVYHLLQTDINQEIYGVPEYLASLQSAWLNESATLFRRKYYENGSHAGFIMYLTDEQMEEDDVDTLRQALKDSKGPGNFKNGFVHSPGGDKDGLKLIPVSEVTAKDEFFNIKNVTMGDVLAGHRVPPQLLGQFPQGAGGFDGIGPTSVFFHHNEIVPLQNALLELNELVGEEVVAFNDYDLDIKGIERTQST